MREIALDTETTGFDPDKGHRIVEIGCVEMFDRMRTGRVFQAYLNPERDMPEDAFKVHGISSEFLADKPFFAEVADDFLAFIGDAPLVIHNAAFDMKFINAELKNVGLDIIPLERATDTVLIARKKFPGSPASLDALCKRFAVDLSGRTKHGALLDSELLCEVYLELMGGRQESMKLKAEREMMLVASADNMLMPLREFLPSEQELEAHGEFLKKIKSPLWKQLEAEGQ
jgi:DNA polymerase-3 subunit epsilon